MALIRLGRWYAFGGGAEDDDEEEEAEDVEGRLSSGLEDELGLIGSCVSSGVMSCMTLVHQLEL